MELMDYQEFEEYVKQNLRVLLPEEYQDSDMTVREVRRPGYTYHGIGVSKQNESCGVILDLDAYYRKYCENASISEIMFTMASVVQTKLPEIEPNAIRSYSWAKDRLFVRVMNRMWNRDYLEPVPHLKIEDLAVTPHILVAETDGQISSTPVTQEMMERYGVTKEQLFQDAFENGQRMFPPEVKVLSEYFGNDKERFVRRIITNSRGVNGAAALFYPGVMEMLTEVMGGDYYAVPTSVHEMILEPGDTPRSEEAMVHALRQTLRSLTEEQDWLSDHIYYYDAQRHQFASVHAEAEQILRS